jgi:hypothetical protein
VRRPSLDIDCSSAWRAIGRRDQRVASIGSAKETATGGDLFLARGEDGSTDIIEPFALAVHCCVTANRTAPAAARIASTMRNRYLWTCAAA